MSISFSIIIPAYNAEHCLELSLGSAIRQDMSNIEIIVVDDASTDSTVKVAQSLSKNDPRVSIVRHSANQGPSAARNTGIRHAKGDYLIFVDADDVLNEKACKILNCELTRDCVDILHFPMAVEMQRRIDDVSAEHMRRYFMPLNHRLERWAIVESAFLHYEHNWNLAGKAIRASLCNNAVEKMPAQRILLGEDLLFYFFLAFYAQTYRGYTSQSLYKYRYGAGGSNREKVNLDVFRQRWLETASISQQIRKELEPEELPASFDTVIASIRRHLLGETIDAAISLLEQKDISTAFLEIQKAWSASEIVCYMSQTSWGDPFWARSILVQKESKQPSIHNGFKNTAHYSTKPSNTIFKQAVDDACVAGDTKGLCFSEEPIPFDSLETEQYRNISLTPRFPNATQASFKYRADVLEECISKYEIGRVVFYDYYKELYFWDVLLLWMLGVDVVDSSGNDLTIHLATDMALKRALEKGQSSALSVALAEKDFMREHLGRDYALASYSSQSKYLLEKTQIHSTALKHLLRKPYHYIKRLFR